MQYKILHIFQIAAKLPKFAVELQTKVRGVAQRIRNDPKTRYSVQKYMRFDRI